MARNVTKAQAQKTLSVLKAKYPGAYQGDLFLSDMEHVYGGSAKTPVIVWEGGPEDWAFSLDTPTGTYGEPVYSWAVALYLV